MNARSNAAEWLRMKLYSRQQKHTHIHTQENINSSAKPQREGNEKIFLKKAEMEREGEKVIVVYYSCVSSKEAEKIKFFKREELNKDKNGDFIMKAFHFT
jgi:uncharacterized protein YrzB (UPF0473 family)